MKIPAFANGAYTLLKPFPCLAGFYVPYGSCADFELARELAQRLIGRSNIQNLLRVKTRVINVYSPDVVVSSFRRSINRIVSVCSQKQMLWIYARRIVALVKNKNPFGDGSEMQDPRSAVRSSLFLGFGVIRESISKSIMAASPQPARVCLIDSLPERFFSRCHATNINRDWSA
jgi:hypothetical protein